MYLFYNENKNGFIIYKLWKERKKFYFVIFISYYIVGVVFYKMVSFYL